MQIIIPWALLVCQIMQTIQWTSSKEVLSWFVCSPVCRLLWVGNTDHVPVRYPSLPVRYPSLLLLTYFLLLMYMSIKPIHLLPKVTCNSYTQCGNHSIAGKKMALVCFRRYLVAGQGHREFPFGNSRESAIPRIPAGIPGNYWILSGNLREF